MKPGESQGVMEDGKLRETQAGTRQGGLLSPLLANVYLHYPLDLWVTPGGRSRRAGRCTSFAALW
jgi:retron-type reverse transcriptase